MPSVPGYSHEIAVEEVIRQIPQLEPYRDQMISMIEEYYHPHSGSENPQFHLIEALESVVLKLLIDNGLVSDAFSSLDNVNIENF